MIDKDTIVIAAASALYTLEHVGPDGKTPDGDDPVMTARATLRAAFFDHSHLIAALAKG